MTLTAHHPTSKDWGRPGIPWLVYVLVHTLRVTFRSAAPFSISAKHEVAEPPRNSPNYIGTEFSPSC
jgi:hypothetical protein